MDFKHDCINSGYLKKHEILSLLTNDYKTVIIAALMINTTPQYVILVSACEFPLAWELFKKKKKINLKSLVDY